MKLKTVSFLDTMTKPQRIAGGIYLVLHMFVLPLLLGMLGEYLPSGIDSTTLNVIYYSIGFAFCLIFMWKFLREAYDALVDNILTNLLTIPMGYFVNILMSYMAAALLLLLAGDALTNPNNEAVLEMVNAQPGMAIGLAVFIGPIVEEILFRGVVFGSLRKRSRVLAFAVSIVAFAFYHVWQFALVSMSPSVFIYMLQYIPAGFALAWSYEKTNCIWVPIFLHMLMNVISISITG